MAKKLAHKDADPFKFLDQRVLDDESNDGAAQEAQVTLRQVFNELAKGNSNRQITQNNPEISGHVINIARLKLIAKSPGLYADYISKWPGSSKVFLLDECVSRYAAISIWEALGRSMHTKYAGLNSAKDNDVWAWAKKNKVDAIITHDHSVTFYDKDLTLIAVKNAHDLLKRRPEFHHPTTMPRLPLIIQLEMKKASDAVALLKQHKQTIIEHINNRTHPYIFLREDRFIEGPSYTDIARINDWDTLHRMTQNILRKEIRSRHSGPSIAPS